jgi:hypothetical protein
MGQISNGTPVSFTPALTTRRGLNSDDSLMPDHPANTADQPEDVATLRAALLAAEARIAVLEQIIHTFQRARFGQSAEQIFAACRRWIDMMGSRRCGAIVMMAR